MTKDNNQGENVIDVAIIGSGPAALSAAIYAGRANLNTVVFEKQQIGGTLNQIAKIENYPGFVGGGSALASNMKDQATHAGAEIEYGTCEKIEKLKDSGLFKLIIDGEEELARTVIIATGSEPRPLGFETKAPVSYCAICDGTLYKDKKVAVVGGGNSALQESMYLADIASTVTIFSHHNLKAEPYLIKKIENYKNIELKQNVEPTAQILDEYDAIFAFIGKRPATSFLEETVEKSASSDDEIVSGDALLDKDGYIITNNGSTIIPGLFAAGDVCRDSVKQVVAATAGGATAALSAIEFLKSLK